MFKVFRLETFEKEIDKCNEDFKNRIKKIELQLSKNPYVGSPLNYQFLREKRIKEKRVYYLIYENLRLILLIAISGKKNQQDTINHIKEQFKEYRKLAEEIAKQLS